MSSLSDVQMLFEQAGVAAYVHAEPNTEPEMLMFLLLQMMTF